MNKQQGKEWGHNVPWARSCGYDEAAKEGSDKVTRGPRVHVKETRTTSWRCGENTALVHAGGPQTLWS